MRTTRLLIGTLACAAAVAGLTGCSSDSGKEAPAAQGTSAGTATAPSAASSPSVPQTSGIEKLTAKQISDKAEAALKAAPSLTLDLAVTSGSDKMKGRLQMDRKGHCVGTMSMGAQGSFAIVQTGGKAWIKPDDAFLKQLAGAEATKLMSGKYIGGSTAKDMSSFCDLTDFTKEIGGDTPEKVTKIGPATVDGIPTVAISATNKDGKSTIYVATQGTPYPVKIVHDGEDAGTVLLSGFDKPVVAVAPPASQVIDPSKL
jgi:hypothetical protein